MLLEDFSCSACGKSYPEVEPYFQTIKGKRYYRPMCKGCDNKRRMDKGYKANPDVQRQAARKFERLRRLDPTRRAQVIRVDCRKTDRKRGQTNDLTVEWITEKISGGCEYCGSTTRMMSLDRIDNAEPHNQDNVNASCIRCNLMRRDMPYAAWLRLIPVIREIEAEGLFGDWMGRLQTKSQ